MKDQAVIFLKTIAIVVMIIAMPLTFLGIRMHDAHAIERRSAWETYKANECTAVGFTAVVVRSGGRGATSRTPGETAQMLSCPRLGENPVIDMPGGPRPFWAVETQIADAALCRARAKAYPWSGSCSA